MLAREKHDGDTDADAAQEESGDENNRASVYLPSCVVL